MHLLLYATLDNEQPLLCTYRPLACLPAAALLSRVNFARRHLRIFPPRSCLVSERALQCTIPRNLPANTTMHTRSTLPYPVAGSLLC